MTAKILVSDTLSEAGLAILRAAEGVEVVYAPGLKEAELAEKIKGFHALVIRSGSKVTAKVIDAADALRVIGRAGIGVDNVYVPAASKKVGTQSIVTASCSVVLLAGVRAGQRTT